MLENSKLSETELKRLKALYKLKILDSPYETLFDNITKVASTICETSISLISLIDENRQWFKSAYGLEGVRETSRDQAFCAYTILTDDVMEIPNALADDRFKENPLVLGEPYIRFYAGAPITLPMGERIGTLCVIDTSPKQLTSTQLKALEGLAKVVSNCLMMQSNLHKRINNAIES